MFTRKRKVLAMLMANNSGVPLAQYLHDGAPFYAPRTSSITQTRGSGTPTITRATTATVTNNDGYQVTALSGELRQQGARRVRNLLTFTEDFSNAAWTKSNVTVSANAIAAPNGTVTADKIYPSGAGNGTAYQSVSVTLNPHVWSIYAKAGEFSWMRVLAQDGSAAPSAYFNLSAGVVGAVDVGITASIADAGDGWYRCKLVRTAADVTGFFNFGPVDGNGSAVATPSGTDGAYFWGAQLEDVTSQTTQTAGEYVSVGVLSAPYHGAGVDGVKYFNTDISGNPIPAATLDGSVVEAAATNLCLQSHYGTGWTASEFTLAANAGVSPTGASDATSIIESTAVTVQHSLLQNVTLTAATYTWSTYVKIASGSRSFTLYPQGAGVSASAVFTLSGAGSVGATAGAQYLSSSIKADVNGWYRVSITFTGAAVAVAHVIYSSNAGEASPGYTGDGTSGFYIFGSQVELGSYATAYQATTTAAVPRDKDILDDQVSGNLTATAGSVAFQWTPSHAPSGTVALCGSYVDASNYTQVLAKKVENLALQSQTFGTTWSNAAGVTSVTDNTTVAPDGTATADTLTAASGVGTHWISQAITHVAGTHTLSVYAKAGTANWIGISDGNATTVAGCFFDVSTGTKGTATGCTGTIETASNGFYRCSITITNPANFFAVSIHTADAQVDTWNSAGTETVIVWGGQDESNSFASPYVATTTAATSATFAIFRKVIAATAYDSYLAHEYVSGTTYDIALRLGASGSQIAVDGVLGTANTTGIEGVQYGKLTGVAGTYFSTPDSVANSITGDIDIRVKCALTDWTPAISVQQRFVAKRAASTSYDFFIRTDAKLGFYDGTTEYSSTSVGPFTDGVTGWVRVTRASASGNANFYTSSDDGVTWTQLGSADIAGAAGALPDTSMAVEIGSFSDGATAPLNGRIYRAQIYNGIDGTLAVDFNPADYTHGTTWTSSATGEVYTINGNAAVWPAVKLGTRWQWGADGNGGQQAGAAVKEKFMWTRALSDSELKAVAP